MIWSAASTLQLGAALAAAGAALHVPVVLATGAALQPAAGVRTDDVGFDQAYGDAACVRVAALARAASADGAHHYHRASAPGRRYRRRLTGTAQGRCAVLVARGRLATADIDYSGLELGEELVRHYIPCSTLQEFKIAAVAVLLSTSKQRNFVTSVRNRLNDYGAFTDADVDRVIRDTAAVFGVSVPPQQKEKSNGKSFQRRRR
jgi:hypothetical protein